MHTLGHAMPLFTPTAAKLTLLEMFQRHYIAYAQIRPSSTRRYRSELHRWDRLMGPIAIFRLTTEHFLAFREKGLEAGLQPETIESSIKIAKAVLRYARDRGWIPNLPVFGKPLRSAQPEPEPATLDEIEALWRMARFATYPGRGLSSPCDWWRSWLLMDFYTALRLEDSLRLAREHFHTDHIRFQASKTSKLHLFPMADPVRWRLDSLLLADSHLLFGRHQQNPLREQLALMCDRACMRRLTPRAIRQSGITQWARADLDAAKLIQGCGLSKDLPRVLTHYLGVVSILRDALPKLEWPPSMLGRPSRQLVLF